MAIVGATLWGIGIILSLIICTLTISRSNYRCKTREPGVQSRPHPSIQTAINYRRNTYEPEVQPRTHLNTRKAEVQPVSWALVLQHVVSLICFLFGLFATWWSGEPVFRPLLPYAFGIAVLCLAAQLILMFLQARRSYLN